MRKMHALLWVAVFWTSFPIVGYGQQAVRWEDTLENAQRLAGQSNRLVLIHFWAPWCSVCKQMEANVYTQPAVAAELAADYVAVKINADHFPATAQKYGVSALPTMVIIAPNGQMLDSMRGRIEAPQYVARLTQVATEVKRRSAAMYAQIPSGNMAPGTNQPASVQTPSMPVAAGVMQSPQPPALATSSLPPRNELNDDRYADYFNRNQPSSSSGPALNGAPTTPSVSSGPALSSSPPTIPATQPSYAQSSPAAIVPTSGSQPVASLTGQMPGTMPFVSTSPAPAYASQQPIPSVASSAQGPQPPMVASREPAAPKGIEKSTQSSGGNPSLGMDGYCPVTLCEKQQWMLGDRRWGAVHRGKTYLFTGPEEQRRFLTDPDRYAPVISGNDLVMAVDQGQNTPGMREHGVYFGNRVYLFASEASLDKFSKNPNIYANYASEALHASNNSGRQVQ